MDYDSSQSIYLQIAQKIIEEIQLGRLLPLTAMPGSRELAERLDVNRKTVVLAYDELIAQGWLVTEKRRGTFVARLLPKYFHPSIDQHKHATGFTASRSVPALPALLDESSHPADHSIDFSDGMPDKRLIPLEVFSRAFRRALVLATRGNVFCTDNPKGRLALRTFIAGMLNMEKGFHVGPDNVCMVRGSQLALFIIARLLVQQRSCVVFESLTYNAAREAFRSCGAEILHAGVDECGIDVTAVERHARQHKVSAVFVTPQHQFPTTVTLSAERRQALLRLAASYDFMIIEFDCDHEFQFAEHAVFPLASMDASDRVIYIGSFSKVFTPELQITYVVGASRLIDLYAHELALIDSDANHAMELAISELMQTGELKRHMRRMFKIYGERRTLLQQLIQTELDGMLDFDLPQGGMAFWLRMRQPVDMSLLAQRAHAEGVGFLPGARFAADAQPVNAIRIGFASLNNKEMVEGVKRIRKALLASMPAERSGRVA